MKTACALTDRCPCSTGLTYGECCGKYHAGTPAPTAEALMRSRYCAFVIKDEPYLMRTWDEFSRPQSLDLADTTVEFYRLDIIETQGGGLLDQTGIVEFEAFYRGSVSGSQRERSAFVRDPDTGAWLYANAL